MPVPERAESEHEAGAEGGTTSAVFVSTLIDLNNRENGDPIAYVRTTLVDQDAGERFLDKQWSAVDIPRAGAQICSFDVTQEDGTTVVQSFPGGRVYVVYTALRGSGTAQRGQILFSYSADCGETWSRPRDISTIPSADVDGDGFVTVADLAVVRASFSRTCGQSGFNSDADVNRDWTVNVLDLASVSRSLGQRVAARRIPQGAAIAIDPVTGAVYVTWREFATPGQPDAIQFTVSRDFGDSFGSPATVATFNPFDQGTSDTSFRSTAYPTLVSDGTRVYLAWTARGYAVARPDPVTGDARIVMSTSANGVQWTQPQVVDEPGRPGHQVMPALTFGSGKLFLLYYDLREDVSNLFGPYVDEFPILNAPPPKLRHTIDARIAEASPGVQPHFASVQLSEYAAGIIDGADFPQQLQFNPPNLPIFRRGTVPFLGDYLDLITAGTIRSGPDGTWEFNLEGNGTPSGHAVWTDNRDVRPTLAGDLARYTPPDSPARRATSLFDPTQTVPSCAADETGTRNQNIYSARFDEGLFAGVSGNSKPLGTLQRAFALFVENPGNEIRSYRLTIPDQPPEGEASFRQFSLPDSPLSFLDVSIPPYSTIARTIYVTSSDPDARLLIQVAEIVAPGEAIVPGGLHTSAVLNPDPSAPRIENPRIENGTIETPRIENAEVYSPRISGAVSSPRIENPRIENPRIENPRIENITVANRDVVNIGTGTPRIENPRIENPRIENPRIENADLVNGSIADTTWEMTNEGNTTAAYTVNLVLNDPIPPGFKTQLVIHKTYTTPAANGCDLTVQIHNVVVANITDPVFSDPADAVNPRIENPRIENATVGLAPGETASVTLRVFDPDVRDQINFTAAASVTPVAVAHAVNTEEASAGVTQPPFSVALTVVTPQLGDSPVGAPYRATPAGQCSRNMGPRGWFVPAGPRA